MPWRHVCATQRVLVALHTDKVEPYAALLEKLSKDKPLALICFGDMKMLEKIPEVVRHASTVILAHSDEKFVQRHVADLFLDNAYATDVCLFRCRDCLRRGMD